MSFLFSSLNGSYSQPSLIWDMLQFEYINLPSSDALDSLHYVQVSLALGSSAMSSELQVQLPQCWVEQKDNLPWPTGNTSNTAQDTTSCCYNEGC